MKVATTISERMVSIAIVAMLTLTLFMTIGCDEGLNMAGEVIDEPADEMVDKTPEPVVTMGEMKKPDSGESAETADPTEATEGPESDPEPESKEPIIQEPAEVVEINYYADADLTVSIRESPYFGALIYEVGTEIYTKVVFSGPVPVTVGAPEVAQPKISYEYSADRETTLYRHYYRMSAREVAVSRLQSGEAKPYKDTDNVFICKYALPEIDLWHGGGRFLTYYGRRTWSDDSPPVRVTRVGQAFDITDPPFISDLFTGSDAAHPAPESDVRDFVGRVCVPFSLSGDQQEVYPVQGATVTIIEGPTLSGNSWLRNFSQGATVTVIEGPKSGESSVTDAGGYYHFRDIFPMIVSIKGANYQVEALHLRVEAEHFEPQEVIVSRSAPTKLRWPKSGINAVGERGPLAYDDPADDPGIIIVGQRWPEEIRFIFEEVLLPDDLLLFVDDASTFPNSPSGFYMPSEGIVGVVPTVRVAGEGIIGTGDMSNRVILHEIMHAHQHAIAIAEGHNPISGARWEATTEGRAYAAAQTQDWRRYGKMSIDRSFELQYHESAHLVEIAAEVGAIYWGIDYLGGISFLRTQAPNRYRWAQEWLNKK